VADACDTSKYGEYAADINAHDKNQWNLLHIAVNEGNLDLAKFVLDKNVDVNSLSLTIENTIALSLHARKR